MSVKREEFCAGNRPAMLDDDMSSKIGNSFVGNSFDDFAGEDSKDFVMRNKGWLVACEIFTGRAVSKEDAGGLPGWCDVNRCDVAAAMETPAAVARPAGLAEIWIDASAGEEFFRRGEEMPVWRWPSDDDALVGR